MCGTVILDDPDAVIDGEPFAHYVCHVTEVSEITRDRRVPPDPGRHDVAPARSRRRGCWRTTASASSTRTPVPANDRATRASGGTPTSSRARPCGLAVGRVHHPRRRHVAAQRLPPHRARFAPRWDRRHAARLRARPRRDRALLRTWRRPAPPLPISGTAPPAPPTTATARSADTYGVAGTAATASRPNHGLDDFVKNAAPLMSIPDVAPDRCTAAMPHDSSHDPTPPLPRATSTCTSKARCVPRPCPSWPTPPGSRSRDPWLRLVHRIRRHLPRRLRRCCGPPRTSPAWSTRSWRTASSTARSGSSRRSTPPTTATGSAPTRTSSTWSSTPPPPPPTSSASGVGVMLAADRTVDPAIAVEQARIAAQPAPTAGVVSFGLANDEAIGPPEPFAEAFAIAKEAGLLSAPHAGELAGPGVGAWRARHARPRPAPARRAGDRGPRAGEAPRRLATSCSTCARRRTCCSRCTRRSPSTRSRSCSTRVSAAVSTATTRSCSGPACWRSTRSCAPRWGSTTVALASIARASIDGSGAPDELKASARRASTTGSRPRRIHSRASGSSLSHRGSTAGRSVGRG